MSLLMRLRKFPFWAWFWFILGALYFILPLYATVAFSLSWDPADPLKAYERSFGDARFWNSFMYSNMLALATIVASIILVVPTAYWIRLRLPLLARDLRFSTNPARVQHRQELIELIGPVLRQRDTADWRALLDALGIPCAPILDVAQVLEHPQVAARGLIIPAQAAPEDGAPGTPPAVAHPILLDGQRPCAALPPPALGPEHTHWQPLPGT